MAGAATHPRFGWAGLLSGPGAWALNTQLGYALAPWICAHQMNLVPYLAAASAMLALLGALVSAHVWRRTGEDQATTHFIAVMSTFIALLFALVIVMQGASGLFFTACER